MEKASFLEGQGFTIEAKQYEKFELTITAESIVSTDARFTMDNLGLGDNYIPLGVYFQKANGDIVKRSYSKGEKRISNQTLPRLACQVFEKQLAALPVEEKENFPVCRYTPNSGMFRGIFTSVDEYQIDNIANRDYLQVLAYMFRFDATTGYYLYPEAGDSDDLKLRMNRGSTYEANVAPRDDISVTKHGLKIPVDATNYAEFDVKMKISEQEFLSVFH